MAWPKKKERVKKAFNSDKGGQAGLVFTINVIRRLIIETRLYLLYVFREQVELMLGWPLAHLTTT